MGDWDDENFEVPELKGSLAKPSSAVKFDEEEDQLQKDSVIKVVGPSPAQIAAAQKKIEQEELMLVNHLKFTAEENETPVERRLREKKQVEDSDTIVASELFGKSSTEAISAASALTTTSSSSKASVSGLGAISLKNKQDHINFAVLCAKKLSESTALNSGVYIKSLIEKMKESLNTETIEELITILNRVRDDKKNATRVTETSSSSSTSKSKTTNGSSTGKKTKKELAVEAAKHSETFGDGEEHFDKYDAYMDLEDDFM